MSPAESGVPAGAPHGAATGSRLALHKENPVERINRYWHKCFSVVGTIALVAMASGSAQGQNLFTNGDFSSGFFGWTQRTTANGVGLPGFVVNFQTNLSLPVSPAARYVVGQRVYRIGQREGVELVQYPNLLSGDTYSITYDWAAVSHPQFINGEGGIFEILVDGQSIAYDSVGIIPSNTTIRRTLTIQFTAQRTGVHEVGARISRPHTVDAVSPTQYVDNFSMTQVGSRRLTLVVSGPCPGTRSFVVSGATARGSVGLITARSTGSFVIPGHMTCGGTQLNLSPSGIQLLTTARADANGTVTILGQINSSACSWAYQAIDASTCRTSN